MPVKSLKPVEWVGSSRKDMKAMPEDVQDTFGFALYLAQLGEKHPDAKPMKGLQAREHWRSSRITARTHTGPSIPSGLPMPFTSCTFSEEIKAWHRHTAGRDREG